MVQITVKNLSVQGFIECPRCRVWHGNKMNPQAVTRKTKSLKNGEKETIESVSWICDECCRTLLDVFAEPDWKECWPLVTDEEAVEIVGRIKECQKAQVQRFRA